LHRHRRLCCSSTSGTLRREKQRAPHWHADPHDERPDCCSSTDPACSPESHVRVRKAGRPTAAKAPESLRRPVAASGRGPTADLLQPAKQGKEPPTVVVRVVRKRIEMPAQDTACAEASLAAKRCASSRPR